MTIVRSTILGCAVSISLRDFSYLETRLNRYRLHDFLLGGANRSCEAKLVGTEGVDVDDAVNVVKGMGAPLVDVLFVALFVVGADSDLFYVFTQQNQVLRGETLFETISLFHRCRSIFEDSDTFVTLVGFGENAGIHYV